MNTLGEQKRQELILVALAKSGSGIGFNHLYYKILSARGSKTTLSKMLKKMERLGVLKFDVYSRRWVITEHARRQFSHPYDLVGRVMQYFVESKLFSSDDDAVKAAIEFWYMYYSLLTSRDTLSLLLYHYETQRFFATRVLPDRLTEEINRAESFVKTARRIIHVIEDELFEILWNFCKQQNQEVVMKNLEEIRASENIEHTRRIQDIIRKDKEAGVEIHLTDRIDELTSTARILLKERYPQVYDRLDLTDFMDCIMKSVGKLSSKEGR